MALQLQVASFFFTFRFPLSEKLGPANCRTDQGWREKKRERILVSSLFIQIICGDGSEEAAYPNYSLPLNIQWLEKILFNSDVGAQQGPLCRRQPFVFFAWPFSSRRHLLFGRMDPFNVAVVGLSLLLFKGRLCVKRCMSSSVNKARCVDLLVFSS